MVHRNASISNETISREQTIAKLRKLARICKWATICITTALALGLLAVIAMTFYSYCLASPKGRVSNP